MGRTMAFCLPHMWVLFGPWFSKKAHKLLSFHPWLQFSRKEYVKSLTKASHKHAKCMRQSSIPVDRFLNVLAVGGLLLFTWIVMGIVGWRRRRRRRDHRVVSHVESYAAYLDSGVKSYKHFVVRLGLLRRRHYSLDNRWKVLISFAISHSIQYIRKI